MRVSAAVTAPRVEQNRYSGYKKIKLYGENNDYPQKIIEIINSSGTGKVCVDIYTKFIEGAGFLDNGLNEFVINSKNEKVTTIRHKCARDLRYFNGCAILVKYNGALEQMEYYNIPFEHCRIEIDDKRAYTGRIAVHPDWTNLKGLTFKTEDVKYLNVYNPLTVRKEMKEAGGPSKYLGQVYYFTSEGDFEYPICPFDPIITDMLTEESVSTVKHRNAKFNFLPSGVLVRKGIKPRTLPNGTTDSDFEDEQESSAAEIKKMQGDSNAAKIWVVDVDSDEEKPEFIPFDAKNYDKAYEYTERTIQDNIARMSMIPPILRGVDVGAGFASELMVNAYGFMNSITSGERDQISHIFMDLFGDKFSDYSLKPLEYIYGSTGNDSGAPAV